MARLRVIGGHTIRAEPQIDAGVSLNMYPELGRRETELQQRPRRFQLPTHGYREFQDPSTQGPCTGLQGTLEVRERLAFAQHRLLRLYTDPTSSLPATLRNAVFSGMPSNRIIPCFGAARVGSNRYWVRSDGQVWGQSAVQAAGGVVVLPFLDVTPLGMGATANAAGTDVDCIFLTCFDDRTVRAWQKVGARFLRRENLDLNLDRTIVNSPQSLWVDPAVTVVETRRYWHVLVTDAIGGRILEFRFEPAADEPWTRVSPEGLANPLDVQNLAGDEDTQEPVVVGGLWANDDEIWVVNWSSENGDEIIRINRATGSEIDSANRRKVPDLTQGHGQAVRACGSVNGIGGSSPWWYVNGVQYRADGQINGAFIRQDGVVRYNGATDRRPVHPGQTPLVPMGDTGRRLGWIVDRRLHVLDLERNRLVTNVDGNVDSVAFVDGRFVGCDASTGLLKVSPVDQEITSRADQYGSPVVAATIQIPAHPRDRPNEIDGFYPFVRGILVASGGNLLFYNRGDLSADPEVVKAETASRRIVGICDADGQVMVIEGHRQTDTSVTLRTYSEPPVTEAAYDAVSGTTVSLRSGSGALSQVGVPYTDVKSWASDGTRLFYVREPATGPRTLLGVIISSGAWQERFRIDPTTGPNTGLFTELTFNTEGATTARDTLWLRGIAWRDGRLLLGVSHRDTEAEAPAAGVQHSTNVTIVALNLGASAWERDAARDLPDDISTDSEMLAGDGLYIYEAARELVRTVLPDGTPVQSTVVAGFRGTVEEHRSRYEWDATRTTPTGAIAVAVIRRKLYSWTRTGLEIRESEAGAEGFPFSLADSHSVGLAARHSAVVLNDVLYWLGTTGGGGLRVWRIGTTSDLIPEAVTGIGQLGEGKSIEEMLDTIALNEGVAGNSIEDIIGFTDDTGGHPTYVMHARRGGISMAYDADAQEWHVRSSLIEYAEGVTQGAPGLEYNAINWDWLPLDQGVQRVTHSTVWQNRPIFAGYDRVHRGVVATARFDDYLDIDGGAVLRRRQFSGGEAERRRIRYPVLRIDAVYGRTVNVATADSPDVRLRKTLPKFRVYVSDDGGRNFGRHPVAERTVGPRGAKPPAPIYGLGISRQRVYRVDFDDPAPFILVAAYQEEAANQVARDW